MRLLTLAVVLTAALVSPLPPDLGHGAGDQGRPLAEDGRVAQVLDRQGSALVRPIGGQRWTPLAPRDVLQPGDQVRIPRRGANAIELELAPGGTVVLGPGGLLDLPQPGVLHLLRGDCEIAAGGAALQVVGPATASMIVASGSTAILRAAADLESLATSPPWLSGYRGSTTDEWMGSLIAQVDGRDVPLSVGVHHVAVEIRDQIARTTVEESFVNATDSTLEGVFYFPLPADASISGFGMWIGDELVEADLVEKQRARAIYEDILRQRKDPALLEWAGGNLFKARVFPIFPHSEKRIRIRYTQVLPLQGDELRYQYPLRSELLRARPVRELSVRVALHSTTPIAEVRCPSHATRDRATEHAASIEFDAEEFSPQRDFELVARLDPGHPLTVASHQRGDDGYVMLLLAPPPLVSAPTARSLLGDDGALDLLLIADTSGSMDAAARRAQSELVAAFLGLLGSQDRFRLMTCDVEPRWFDVEPAVATEERTDAALSFLDARASLGWTDLDAAFDAALPGTTARTLVVYIGDGTSTTGDADPVAMAQRLQQRHGGIPASCHAVVPSAAHERVVLEAIAAIGGGSVRRVGDDPAATAFQLLREAARPTIKDLAIEFEGLRTARVYPARLPNLPLGAQQVVLGRFMPTAGAQRGTVIVRGTLGGEPVEYRRELVLEPGDSGNSFIPRLWARRHLDALLQEGRTPEIQAEVVSFSQEYGIVTPYTSFLVLETDRDRERYGVQRRVKMRDGEAFFADGRDRARMDLLAQQMRVARGWRRHLRQQMLQEIATLGEFLHEAAVGDVVVGSFAGFKERAGAAGQRRSEVDFADARSDERAQDSGREAAPEELERDDDAPMEVEEELVVSSKDELSAATRQLSKSADFAHGASPVRMRIQGLGRSSAESRSRLADGWAHQRPRRIDFAELGFPGLPDAPAATTRVEAPQWPPSAAELLVALDRSAALRKRADAVQLRQVTTSYDGRRGEATGSQRIEAHFGPPGWLVRSAPDGGWPTAQWVYEGQRAIVTDGLRLGRRRPAGGRDKDDWPVWLGDLSTMDLARTYGSYAARLVREANGVAEVELAAPAPNTHVLQLHIDRARRCLRELRQSYDGKAFTTIRFTDFVEVAGRWWAREAIHRNPLGQITQRRQLQVEARHRRELIAVLGQTVAAHADAIWLGPTDPPVAAAREAVRAGRAGFAEHLALVLDYASTQQWEPMWSAWQPAARVAAGRPGLAWLRVALLAQSRHGTQLVAALRELGQRIVDRPGPATEAMLEKCIALARPRFEAHELLALLDELRPAYARGPGDRWRQKLRWRRLRAETLLRVGDADAARALYGDIALERPFELRAVTDYLGALQAAGRRDEVRRVAQAALAEQDWRGDEADRLYQTLTDELWRCRDLPALVEQLERWVARRPTRETAYQRWLSMLLLTGATDRADAWVRDRLVATWDRDLEGPEFAELGAAIGFALGRGWNYWGHRLREDWLGPLADLARRLAQRDGQGASLAQRILHDGRFQQTDAAAALRGNLLDDLLDGAIETASPARLAVYVQWLRWGREDVEPKPWRRVSERLRQRFEATALGSDREHLARLVLALLDGRGEREAAVAFLRGRVDRVASDVRGAVATDLLHRLADLEWSTEREDEMLRLVPAVQRPEATEEAQRERAARTLRWLTEVLLHQRYIALLGPVAELEALERHERRTRERTARRRARAELAARFGRERDRADAVHAAWFELERLGQEARLGADVVATDGAIRELLFGTPPNSEVAVDRQLRERCAYVVAYCAAHATAPERLGDSALEMLRSLDAQERRWEADGVRRGPYQVDWRWHEFRLLVGLDRLSALRRELSAWRASSPGDPRWRRAFAYVAAEQGDLGVAVAELEPLARAAELEPQDYEALADWLLASGEVDRAAAARAARFAAEPEHALAQRLRQTYYRLRRDGEGTPEELQADDLLALEALLRRATDPARYIGHAEQLYSIGKDHRCLAALAEGVVGHTPQGVYGVLERAVAIVRQVHEEATCMALVARVDARLRDAASGSAEARGLLLLRALAERRAAEVLNAPGPHAARGLAALQQASRGAWGPGERRLMASFLAALGRIPQTAFAAEQLRQLRQLYEAQPKGSEDRLRIASAWHRTQWAYGEHDAAIMGLKAALQESREGLAGVLAAEGLSALETLVDWFEARRHFARAERCLLDERERQPAGAQRQLLGQRLYRLYVSCLRQRGQTSLGRDATLYRGAKELLEEALRGEGPEQMPNTLGTLCQLHRAAQERAGVTEAGEDLRVFATERLPGLLNLVPADAPAMALTVAQTVEGLVGPRAALAILIERLEVEPKWLESTGQGGWNRFAWNLAEWREEAGPLGELEPRLLRLVIAELARDLRSAQARTRALYARHSSRFWEEKAGDFEAVARAVIGESLQAPARLLHVADYLWQGLERRDLAIATLRAARQRGQLRVDGALRLVGWLHHERRFDESVPVVSDLVASRPDLVAARTLLIAGLHGAGRDQQALVALAAAEQHLRGKEWSEALARTLAQTALECRLYAPAVRLFEEAIAARQRRPAGRRGGDAELSADYAGLARAHSGLGHVDAAVDAACGAVVAWGRSQRNRAHALGSLRDVLGKIEDLPSYIARMEQRVAETRLDAPVIRKAVGMVLLAKGDPERAIAQLQAASALQPHDAEVHQALLVALDATGDARGACEALRAAICAAPEDLELYRELGKRLAGLGDEAGAERAWTTLVEVLPNEAESHRLLAEELEAQERFAEAAAQWRQVVRVRTDEPDGWFRLASSQVGAGQEERARETLEHVLETQWPSRFGGIKERALELLRPLRPSSPR
ncbi:MAG: VIT domain-containing protein [Planctomycetota bacterium]